MNPASLARMNFTLRFPLVVLTATHLVAQSQTAPIPAATPTRGPQPRHFGSLSDMHAAYVTDFASKPGFGASRMVFLPPQDFLTHAGETYRFGTPDLIGLEDKPTAYHASHSLITVADLSRKEARAHLRRRALSDDETLAVAELRAGKDTVTLPKQVGVLTVAGTNEVTGMLAVAALRATAKCAECHQVPEGTLLGAFAYTLVPTNGVAPALSMAAIHPQ